MYILIEFYRYKVTYQNNEWNNFEYGRKHIKLRMNKNIKT